MLHMRCVNEAYSIASISQNLKFWEPILPSRTHTHTHTLKFNACSKTAAATTAVDAVRAVRVSLNHISCASGVRSWGVYLFGA